MTKKEIKNRQMQNEFVAKLQNCMNAFDEADKLFDEIDDFIKNKMPNETSKFDSEQQDYLHILEDYELTDNQLISIGRRLEANRNDRKNWHNIFTISSVWNEHKGKVFNRNSRVFLKEALARTLKSLDNDWNFRILSEEEVNTLLSDTKATIKTPSKRGRGRKANVDAKTIDYIIDRRNSGIPVKTICDTLNMKPVTVYAILKRYKDRVK